MRRGRKEEIEMEMVEEAGVRRKEGDGGEKRGRRRGNKEIGRRWMRKR
jgi:hypothetical protein